MPHVTLTLWVVLLIWLGWMVWQYLRIRKAATFLDNDAFAQKLHGAQVIDIRDAASFHRKHILGARHFPIETFKQSLSALRKDKPVLLYEGSRGNQRAKVILTLKKAGFTDIYVLKDGFEHWNGKTKS